MSIANFCFAVHYFSIVFVGSYCKFGRDVICEALGLDFVKFLENSDPPDIASIGVSRFVLT